MKKTMMLIINPVAGKGGYKDGIADILEIFAEDYIVSVYMTQHRGHATEIVSASGGSYDTVVCCGGDGTLSETIAGLMELEEKPWLGYIPMGTANDVASTLNIPHDPKHAAEIIVGGRTIPFDVGSMDGKYFTYISAFGAFTEVSYQTPKETKQTLGHLAYVIEGMGHLGNIMPQNLKVEYNDEVIEGEYIFGAVTNTTSIAGLVKLKDGLVGLGDGEFEVILVKNPKNILDVNRIFLGIFAQQYDKENAIVFKASEVKFTFDEEVRWTRDGEDGGKHKEVTLKNIKAPIYIIVPQ